MNSKTLGNIPHPASGKDIFIREEPKEGRELIRKTDMERMGQAIRTGGARKIQLKDVKIMFDDSGMEIDALQSGGVISVPSTHR